MNAHNQKILIVEDDPILRDAVTIALQAEGFEVLAAEDGEMGLRMALEEKPNLVLLDMMLPKMEGITVLAKLREDEDGKKIPVIVLTALDDMSKIADVIEAGGNDYIVKTNVTLSGIIEKVKERIG